ncbi:VirB3 family type IV secretion system protein (plasmid) [Ralstonia solanacearum]|uniref:VirB3 family type IV secretion system protein n=1 Tax=Ralstonia solanacearum TaxID=305 RepID=UPI003217357F
MGLDLVHISRAMLEKPKYSAYAGLGRVASWRGIPLMALLIIAGTFAFIALVAGALMGPGGLLLGGLAIPILLFIRRMCETDDQALRILWLEVLCVLRRRSWRMFGRTLTLAPIRYGQHLSVYRRPFRKSPAQRAQ